MAVQRGDKVTNMSPTKLSKLKTEIGFIGLGLMGSRLTRRLHSAGWNVHAWNRSPRPADVLRRDGIGIAASVAELVIHSDVVLSSLANDEAVYSVYFSPDGVFSALRVCKISKNVGLLFHLLCSL